MMEEPNRTHQVEEILKDLMSAMNWDDDPNFKDTPRRVAKWLEVYQGLSKGQVEESIQRHLKAKFPTNNKGLIIQDPIKAFSMCPHHMLMIEYDVYVGYVPDGEAIGLSKLSRIAIDMARYPYIQEDYTTHLAEALLRGIQCKGTMVVVKGVHNCMRCRGVKQPGAVTTTSAITGVFAYPPKGLNPRQEFLALLKIGQYRIN